MIFLLVVFVSRFVVIVRVLSHSRKLVLVRRALCCVEQNRISKQSKHKRSSEGAIELTRNTCHPLFPYFLFSPEDRKIKNAGSHRLRRRRRFLRMRRITSEPNASNGRTHKSLDLIFAPCSYTHDANKTQ